MTSKQRNLVGAFAAELSLYTTLVTAYFYGSLYFLGPWLKQLFDSNRIGYAIAALALIIGQGVVLEVITTRLLKWLRDKIH